ncbi:BTB/POZ domain-containing protein 13 [Fasciola hepatica]|uniref:BTB/POZ domain-containing protein 13 n=1 Tax=Fasciola hepatica TaxID=6192 RepID=A0A4E0RX30_FASHE|nr:BTB/POZ domain-containing protein 13 [Fasciola hepatica]
MGSYFSLPSSGKVQINRKRKNTEVIENELPIKKRIRSTYDYVYRELFCKGEGSDLTVKSMGYTWLLHRLYVKQSPFFCAMLDGGWKESESDVIELELSDTNITKSSLDVIFGSFYHDSVVLSENTVLSVLAAATWFHLEEVRSLCSEFMECRTSMRNAVEFFQIAKQYNLPNLTKKTISWTADHLLLLHESSEHFEFLRKIPVGFMCEVIRKPDLVVVQLEHDVLTTLLKWVYLQQHPEFEYNPESPPFLKTAYAYFTSTGGSFLETDEGKMYIPAFQSIRWDYLVNEHKVTQRLLRDRIIPEDWLSNVFSRQWLRVLQTHELQVTTARHASGGGRSGGASDSYGPSGSGSYSPSRLRATLSAREFAIGGSNEAILEGLSEPGPPADLPEEVFWATSERCGRHMLSGDSTCSWRWTGYHFGIDVVIKYKRRTFSVIRFTEPSSSTGAISHVPRFRLMIAMRVRSLASIQTSNGEAAEGGSDPTTELVDVVRNAECHSSDTSTSSANSEASPSVPKNATRVISTEGVLSLSLEQNVIQDVLRLPEDFQFPAVVSANILRYDPFGWESGTLSTETDQVD